MNVGMVDSSNLIVDMLNTILSECVFDILYVYLVDLTSHTIEGVTATRCFSPLLCKIELASFSCIKTISAP